MKLSTKDVRSALITGLTTGLIAWQVFAYLGQSSFFGIPVGALVVIVPIAWIAGVWLGYFLGQWVRFFNQFGRFAAIGFTNSAVDFGVLYLLIGITDITKGVEYSFFKATSFLVALVHSYFWNRHWSFEQKDGANRGEFVKFASVSFVAFLLNVGIASFLNAIPEPISAKAWAGIAAMGGAAVALIVSFVGYKLIVFKR